MDLFQNKYRSRIIISCQTRNFSRNFLKAGSKIILNTTVSFQVVTLIKKVDSEHWLTLSKRPKYEIRQCFRYIDPSEVNGSYEAGTAESICQSYGDKLPFPKSSNEKKLLRAIAKQFKLTGARYYPIDLKLSGSDYFMSNGQRPVNEHWMSGEPDYGKRRDFVVSPQFIFWLDVDSNFVSLISIICQQICSPGN